MESSIVRIFAESCMLQSVTERLRPVRPGTDAGHPTAPLVPEQIMAAISQSLVLNGLVQTLILSLVPQPRHAQSSSSLVALTIPKAIQLPGLRCLGAGGGGPPR